MKTRKKLRVILIASIILLNIICDLVSKSIARNSLNNNETITIIKDFLILKKAENSGAAFGLGSNMPSTIKTIYFQLLPIIFLIYVFRMILIKTEFSKLTVIGVAFAIGGGFGNIYDRIFYGSVTDFIILKIGILKNVTFNIADVVIIIGFILAFLGIFFTKNDNHIN